MPGSSPRRRGAPEHDDGYACVVSAARHVASLLDLGIKRVLVTLGEHGAISASANGVWYARTENAPVITAVGRGAAATAGWLMACEDGAAEPDRLARALAYAVARGARRAATPRSRRRGRRGGHPQRAHPGLTPQHPGGRRRPAALSGAPGAGTADPGS